MLSSTPTISSRAAKCEPFYVSPSFRHSLNAVDERSFVSDFFPFFSFLYAMQTQLFLVSIRPFSIFRHLLSSDVQMQLYGNLQWVLKRRCRMCSTDCMQCVIAERQWNARTSSTKYTREFTLFRRITS